MPRQMHATALLTCSAESHLEDRCGSGTILRSSKAASWVQITCCTGMKKVRVDRRKFLYVYEEQRAGHSSAHCWTRAADIHNANAGTIPEKSLAAVTGAFCLSCVKVLVIVAPLLCQARRAACDNLGSGAPHPRRINTTLYASIFNLVHPILLQSHLYGSSHSLFSASPFLSKRTVYLCFHITSHCAI